ncbi:hypothetical protein [Moorena producens]|uniref:hypothetical protein n=1 Tax=Moorena producens TaxID=1155739 RepID=UPI003C77CD66
MKKISKQPADQQILETIALVEQPQPLGVNLAPWLKNGNSAAEILLATAVLVVALTGLLTAVLPYWTNKK